MKTIFILDKDSARQDQMTKHLTSLGFSVRCFSSAAEFDGVNEKKPFLIILDEKMESGEKSGVQFLKKVRRKMSGVPVVYMTARLSSPKLINDARKMGAYEVIEKNAAEFVNLRTTLDKLINDPPKSGWFANLFPGKQVNVLPALSV